LPSPVVGDNPVAVGQYERALQVLATHNYAYGISLLLACCKLEPANLRYRQALRRTQKALQDQNARGRWFSWLWTLPALIRLKAAKRAQDHHKVLECGEHVLTANPWHLGSQLHMAQSAVELGLDRLAIWILEEARPQDSAGLPAHRFLAQLYERRQNYVEALALWERVAKAVPGDSEAHQQLKVLAVRDTLARGRFNEVDERSLRHRSRRP
jgi:tetratricopeptide (TPR) repeat protein